MTSIFFIGAESKMERDHFLSAEAAKTFGLVDKLLEKRPVVPKKDAK